MSSQPKPPLGVPPPQHNLQTATDKAFDALRNQTPDQLIWLGVSAAGDLWRLPVLNSHFAVDLANRRVCDPDGRDVSGWWRIMALHYLATEFRPVVCPPEVVFGNLPDGRGYASVYHARVINRLCATAGRDLARLQAAAQAIGAAVVQGGDFAFDVAMFPRVSLRLVWYAGDDEFPPSASLLLPGNIEAFFCVEDVVVLSECLVSRLCGKPF